MQIEFDPVKDAINTRDHGLSLAYGARVFDDAGHLVLPTHRQGDGEDRWKVVGLVGDSFYAAVYVWRGDVIRFISVRRSNAGEEQLYHSAAGRPE